VHALAAIPVTIVSASKQPAGAPNFLGKPVDLDALLGLVEKTCGC
jgi:FixJ family two-component response regulator